VIKIIHESVIENFMRIHTAVRDMNASYSSHLWLTDMW